MYFYISHQNTHKMNTLNLRLKTKKDILPTQLNNQSWMQWFEQWGGKNEVVYGTIGHTGTKVHTFVASYLNLNGENIIISLSSLCGSQTWKSGLSLNLTYTQDKVTCKKCCK